MCDPLETSEPWPPNRDAGAPAHHYMVGGLLIASQLPLDSLKSMNRPASDADVYVTLGSVPRRLPQATAQSRHIETLGDSTLLISSDEASFLVRNGHEIIVEPLSPPNPEGVQAILLGSAFAAICYQRGLLPLHASVIAVRGRGVGFAGKSGTGKSTLAAYFACRGFPVLCDDLCTISPAVDGALRLHAGPRRIKLSIPTLQVCGMTSAGLTRDPSPREKYHLPLDSVFDPGPLPPWKFYLLDDPQAAPKAQLARVKPSCAVGLLARNSFRPQIVEALGVAERQFLLCAAVAGAAEVHSVARPWGLNQLDALGNLLMRDWEES